MNNDKLNNAIIEVYKELSQLNNEEFYKKLEDNKNKDIAKIILETNALSVGEIESESFETNNYIEELDLIGKNIINDFDIVLDTIDNYDYEFSKEQSDEFYYNTNIGIDNIKINEENIYFNTLDLIFFEGEEQNHDIEIYFVEEEKELEWAA